VWRCLCTLSARSDNESLSCVAEVQKRGPAVVMLLALLV
jgi:hypothetical protein